ncbi:hypothetical protein LSG31_09300 [Fodinisporobacter ferrooxydans]|uniref:Uncharacterized protein n=1 Tax=Fodinisporobacter ferrooxydans TaxID=2901836 RepID=A0ABY4CPB2_9BACL|nr:hypothetical protein LSG31_04350 [Alicyclobacillaceae bacterium MYW30-H2]UOF92335.1 hypothetical protein LSG31_09300 [Alicyclobacillaceae bacterium MYW30-H2]
MIVSFRKQMIVGNVEGVFFLAEVPGFDFSETFGRVNGHAFHEQAKLPDRYSSYISRLFGPLESSTRAVKSLIIEDKAVAIPTQAFQPISAFVTEQEKVVSEWIHFEFLFHDNGQAVY